MANEGKVVGFVAADAADAVLAAMRRHPKARDAAMIGRVTEQQPATVVAHTAISANA